MRHQTIKLIEINFKFKRHPHRSNLTQSNIVILFLLSIYANSVINRAQQEIYTNHLSASHMEL